MTEPVKKISTLLLTSLVWRVRNKARGGDDGKRKREIIGRRPLLIHRNTPNPPGSACLSRYAQEFRPKSAINTLEMICEIFFSADRQGAIGVLSFCVCQLKNRPPLYLKFTPLKNIDAFNVFEYLSGLASFRYLLSHQ